MAADASAVQNVSLAIDTLDGAAVLPFWRAMLAHVTDEEGRLGDPHSRWSPIWFQQMDTPREQRNRIHVDVFVPDDQAQQRITATLAAGGRVVYDAEAPEWWTLADPEGNEVDIAVAVGREELWAAAQEQGTG